MGKKVLVDEDIKAGSMLVNALETSTVPVDALFWRYSPETNEYELIIATSLVDTLGPIAAYTKIQETLAAYPSLAPIHLADITVTSPSSDLVRALQSVVRVHSPAGVVRVAGVRGGSTLFEDVVIYRLTGSAAVGAGRTEHGETPS